MAKLTTTERKHFRPKPFAEVGRSFPVSGDSPSVAGTPRTQKVMEGGYGTVNSTRPKESAIVKKSRAQLIKRLGILPRKSK